MAKAAFEKYTDEPGFEYLRRMAKHIDLVASIPIRNVSRSIFLKEVFETVCREDKFYFP